MDKEEASKKLDDVKNIGKEELAKTLDSVKNINKEDVVKELEGIKNIRSVNDVKALPSKQKKILGGIAAVVALLLFLVFSGGDPTFDMNNPNQSYNKMVENLSESEQHAFANSVLKVDPGAISGTGGEKIHGKTVKEINAMAR